MRPVQAFLDERALSATTGLSRRTLQRSRVSGDGPPFTRLGPRRVLYRAEDVAAWAEANSFPHRAAEMAKKPSR